MRKQIIGLLSIMIIGLVMSCSEEPTPVPKVVVPKDTFTMTVDGIVWTPDSTVLIQNPSKTIDNVTIRATQLSTGNSRSFAPSQFKGYFNSGTDFSIYNIEGITPKTLGTTKEQLAEGMLKLIRKKI